MFDRVQVYGPAYLDRVLRVDSPLTAPPSPPIDESVGGRARFDAGDDLTLTNAAAGGWTIQLPDDWNGPRGTIDLDRRIGPAAGLRRALIATSWEDDLGGMGAGFAAATGGRLTACLGPITDPTSATIADLLQRRSITAEIVRLLPSADWTLLISSGPHGDKLAVGFRSVHAALTPLDLAPSLRESCDLRIVAGLPNRLAGAILKAPGARVRMLAPAMRNMRDRESPLLGLIAPVDVLCCNRGEWEALEDREEVAARLSILVVTEGAAGASARFTDLQGSSRTLRIAAFPRTRPPRDTNRAGEAFASFFLESLLKAGWRPEPGVVAEAVVRSALVRASAASALTIDLLEFGFPTAAEIDAALDRGVVG